MFDWKTALNAPTKAERLAAVAEVKKLIDKGELTPDCDLQDVNNHIHTTYSFSPYSPSRAVVEGWKAGLKTIGIMDHDSIGGADEFVKAAEIIGIAATCGIECRVSMKDTPFLARINNPDQDGVAYVSIHGVPHTQFGAVEAFYKPYRDARNVRNRKMTDNINALVASSGIHLDFDKDIVPLSMSHDGGSITERHLCFALSKKIVEKAGKAGTVDFLKNVLGIPVSAKVEGFLSDPENPHFEYDLLGALKSNLVGKFYIDATDECPSLDDYIAFAKKIGGISAYPYLGDVGDSVTGDKKPQKFEDSFLPELFGYLKGKGMNSITYMPSRNTKAQLERVQALADELGFFKISGEDINSPRQNFICYAQRDEMFAPLYDAAWALIGHEAAATEALEDSFFSEKTVKAYPTIAERTAFFAEKTKKKFGF